MEIQALVSKKDSATKQDELDLFVGLHTPLDSPFNIFLRIEDIEKNNSNIYFYAYSLGKQKIVLWGIYNKENNEFLIDNACQYQPNNLKEIVNSWKESYRFTFTAMKNNINSRMLRHGTFGSDSSKRSAEFRELFIKKLQKEGLISSTTADFDEKRFNEIVHLIYKDGLLAAGKKELEPTLKILLSQIESKEDTDTVFGMVTTGEWKGTKYQRNVAKYILIHLYLMAYLTIDDYRTAKYFVHDVLDKAKKTFMYDWLLELGKIFRVYDYKTFMKTIAKDIIRFTEENINMTNIGVIGGPEILKTELLSSISDLFENFISTSKYTKLTYVNQLNLCPTLQKCDKTVDKACDLYTHGQGKTSKYDLT